MAFLLKALGLWSTEGLGSHSTAKDVIEACGEGEYLLGKTAIVTGGNSGIGLETCKALASAGCSVVLCSRSVEAGEQAVKTECLGMGEGGYRLTEEQAGRVQVQQLDLNSLANIELFCARVKQDNLQIDLLVLNAGIMALPTREETVDGFEKQVGVNHFGHAFLVRQLYGKLTADAKKRKAADVRVVVLSSSAHSMGSVQVQDLHFATTGRKYSQWGAYGQSKQCNLLFAKGLALKLEKEGHGSYITAMSLHPGVIQTALWRETALATNALIKWFGSLFLMNKTIPQGAATTLFAALSPLAGPTATTAEFRGGYLEDCDLSVPKVAEAEDLALVQALWEETEKQLSEKQAQLDKGNAGNRK